MDANQDFSDEVNQFASKYKLIVEETQSGNFIGSVREFPNVVVQEKTSNACYIALLECLKLAIEFKLSFKTQLPAPFNNESSKGIDHVD